MHQHLPLLDPPKFTQIWDFWLEKKPSGNPVIVTATVTCDRPKLSAVKFGNLIFFSKKPDILLHENNLNRPEFKKSSQRNDEELRFD
jgi:hypothetical protein